MQTRCIPIWAKIKWRHCPGAPHDAFRNPALDRGLTLIMATGCRDLPLIYSFPNQLRGVAVPLCQEQHHPMIFWRLLERPESRKNLLLLKKRQKNFRKFWLKRGSGWADAITKVELFPFPVRFRAQNARWLPNGPQFLNGSMNANNREQSLERKKNFSEVSKGCEKFP